MNSFKSLGIPFGNAICYSGYRDGQRPGGSLPSYVQVKEDLEILEKHWQYLRLFDCDEHSKMVFDVIRNEGFNFKVMLGAYIVAEKNNFNCPWGGGIYPRFQLEKNKDINKNRIDRLIEFGNEYKEIIFSLSVGNEACVGWTDHLVPQEKVIEYVKKVQKETTQPVTFCENYVPWIHELEELAYTVDFISIHTYPVWEYKPIHEGLSYTQQNFFSVQEKYPDVPVIITEAGWTTRSNGKGIEPSYVNEEFQKVYFDKLNQWAKKEDILTFYFEAFDENWKGAPEPLEPEKHWGLYDINRKPKLAVSQSVNI